MEMGGGPQSPPLQTAVDTEQVRNVQDSEMYSIHVSGTKKVHLTRIDLNRRMTKI